MDIWIRTQNRERLLKVNDIFMGVTKNIVEMSNVYLLLTFNGREVELGRYKSKERALEVLDEIQDKIKNMYILENCKLPKKSCIEQSLVMNDFNIYEMPNEWEEK